MYQPENIAKSLSESDKQFIWHPYTQMLAADPAIVIERGEGSYLYDEEGNKYIDAISSWWTNLHGHSHPYLAEKVSDQLRTLEHVMFAGFTHKPAITLAERLLQHLPNNQGKIFYSDNGSTAVEVALKMAIQYWYNKGEKRTKIIAFEQAYHGDTFGAMSASGRSVFTKPFNDLIFEVVHIPVPVKNNRESMKALQDAIRRNGSSIACFIFEPLILGTAGMVMYPPEYLDELIAFCKQENILTIADEVMTGFGRTGKFFASDYLSEHPDIFCLSKGLTGGTMAMGVTSCSDAVYEAFLSNDVTKTFFHGHSYTANPIACTAALASLDLMERQETWSDIERINNCHLDFQKTIKHKEVIKDCRVLGTILAIELETKSDTGYFNSIRNRLYRFFIERKIILRPLGNIIYVMPPYCISNDDLQIIYSAITEALDNTIIIK